MLGLDTGGQQPSSLDESLLLGRLLGFHATSQILPGRRVDSGQRFDRNQPATHNRRARDQAGVVETRGRVAK